MYSGEAYSRRHATVKRLGHPSDRSRTPTRNLREHAAHPPPENPMTDTSLFARWRSWSPYLLSILRIVAAFLFIQVGTAKVLGFPAAVMPGGGTAPITTLPGF